MPPYRWFKSLKSFKTFKPLRRDASLAGNLAQRVRYQWDTTAAHALKSKTVIESAQLKLTFALGLG